MARRDSMIESRRVHSITGWGPMPRWFACALLGSLCAAVASACGGDRGEKIVAPDAVVGTYSLETIQNKSLPATLIDDNGYTLRILAGTYSLGPQGTYTSMLTVRESIETLTGPNVAAYDERGSGVYSLTAQVVRFTDAQGGEFTGTLSGNILSFDGILPQVYRR